MTWKCPECGVKLKAKGTHPQTHDRPVEPDFNAIEEYLSFGPQLGGEVSRLRSLRKHDETQDWDSVYHGYVKVGKEDGAQAQTQRERNVLRQRVWAARTREKW